MVWEKIKIIFISKLTHCKKIIGEDFLMEIVVDFLNVKSVDKQFVQFFRLIVRVNIVF